MKEYICISCNKITKDYKFVYIQNEVVCFKCRETCSCCWFTIAAPALLRKLPREEISAWLYDFLSSHDYKTHYTDRLKRFVMNHTPEYTEKLHVYLMLK